MHSKDRLIEGNSTCIKGLNPLIKEIFASWIDTYACYFNFLIEIAVSPTMISVNVLPLDSPYITNVLVREAIAPREPSIVIDNDQEPFVLLAEGAHKALEEVSMH
jgi:hypothetical protein